MAHAHSADKWDDHSSKCASSVQDITKLPCKTLLEMANSILPTSTSTSKVLDNGAGSGMFTSVLLAQYPDTDILAADVSQGMITSLSQNDWLTVKTVVADAMDLHSAGLQDQSFTHSMGTFFLPFVSDPKLVIREMVRVTQPGGVVGVSTWSRVSWVPLWQAAVRSTLNSQWEPPPLFHAKTTELEDVKALFEEAGLGNIEAKTFACPHPKKESPEKAVEEFLNMGNPSTKLLMEGFSAEEIERIKPEFVRGIGNGMRGWRFRRRKLLY